MEKDRLYSKRGRWERFKTAAHRNEWLNKEIKSLKEQIGVQKNQMKIYSAEILKSKNSAELIDADAVEIRNRLNVDRSEFESISLQCEETRVLRNKLDEKRKYILLRLTDIGPYGVMMQKVQLPWIL